MLFHARAKIKFYRTGNQLNTKTSHAQSKRIIAIYYLQGLGLGEDLTSLSLVVLFKDNFRNSYHKKKKKTGEIGFFFIEF